MSEQQEACFLSHREGDPPLRLPAFRTGSLFSGIGGFDLAAEWLGWQVQWFSEIDAYANRVLAKWWPTVPNHGDITKLNGAACAPIDCLHGGFPCQDISLAGRGAGLAGERSGLWRHYVRIIDERRPPWVVAENVPALRSRGLDVVLQDLVAIGYDAQWHCIPACAVGAPHRRDRIWIVAYPQGLGLGPRLRAHLEATFWGRRLADGGGASGDGTALMDDGLGQGLQGYAGHGEVDGGRTSAAGSVAAPSLPRGTSGGPLAGCGRPVESGLGGSADGIPGRVDRWPAERGPEQFAWEPPRVGVNFPKRKERLQAIGNALVPEVAFRIFAAIDALRREII